jgi:Uma2 family endonuclease
MPQAQARWTAEMVRALPNDGNRYEVVDGELLVTPSPNPRHQRAVAAIQFALTSYARASGIGETLASPADISTGADRLVQPDLFVFARGRHPIREWTEIKHLLLAVEVLSPSTARADRQVKRRLYQEIADQYWIVDLDARLVERWQPADTRPDIVTATLSWSPAMDAAPIFTFELPAFFDGLGPD